MQCLDGHFPGGHYKTRKEIDRALCKGDRFIMDSGITSRYATYLDIQILAALWRENIKLKIHTEKRYFVWIINPYNFPTQSNP